MTVKIEASGRRSVSSEVEVPGTPEQVWDAIATGPGVSSWFVPTEFEHRDGKPVALKAKFGHGMEPRSIVTVWDPPRTFTTELESLGGSPPFATEWNIEARAGGVCVVRIVQSLFASTDDWDDHLEGAKGGLSGFIRALRVYLTHFRGQYGRNMQVVVPAAGSEAQVWATLASALGVQGAQVGQHLSAPAGVPAINGVVEYYNENPYDALVRLDAPGPGIAAVGAFEMGGQSMVALGFYLYGEQAAETLARETPGWQAWLQEVFPTAQAQ